MSMTSRQRFLTALDRGVPDRLPVTTHHVMPYFLERSLGGISTQAFFDRFGLDPILWLCPIVEEPPRDDWRVERVEMVGRPYPATRISYVTPGGTLTTLIESNDHTAWVTEYLIKEKRDIEILGEFAPAPLCDVAAVNRAAAEFGERGLVRGNICCFDCFGQPGCWQDAACMVGVQRLILETFRDPQWVHALLDTLCRLKEPFARSLRGARFDLLEHGGGHASSTVISPGILEAFVAPYDARLIALAHEAGQRVVYHTCGGMMPFLELLADMGPDAMETFTPRGMGGDADLAEARARLGDRVCMIGGFDQFHHFTGCSPEETRAAVRRCFEAAGRQGAYILSPSDHFFEADIELLEAYADEGRSCVYAEGSRGAAHESRCDGAPERKGIDP